MAKTVWVNGCAIVVLEDSVGSIFTTSPDGGAVLIAGTGSIGELVSSSGIRVRTGGWGHMLGDEAGAYWIASTAARRIAWALDGFAAPGPTEGPETACVPVLTGAEHTVW